MENEASRVLVVEDHKYNQLVIQKMIESIGLPVITASNGKEAIGIFSKSPDISLVFMDIKLPEMDGIQVMNEIRKIKPETVVIAETAYAMPGDREKLLEAGFDDYLAKPFTIEDIKQIFRKYLGCM